MKLRNILTIAALALTALTASAQQTAQVAVFCINDFHCGLIHDPQRGTPGAAWVVQTLDSLKQVYPNHLTVSAGDNYGGSFFYTATQEKSLIPQAFRDMGIDISVPGNHAFDIGQEHTADLWQSTIFCPRDWKMRYVCANMRKEPLAGSGQVPAIPDYCQPWVVEKVELKEGGSVNVAFTGLMTSNTPNQASASRIKGLTFDGNYSACLDSIKRLPGYEAVEKANVHLLLTHISTFMKDGEPVFDDRDQANLYAFDRPDIDGIFTAHSHEVVCGTVKCARPYPVVQGGWHGQYIAMMLCDVDLTTGRCVKVTPKLVRVNPNAQLGPKARRLQAQVQEQYDLTTFRGLPLSTVLTHCREDIVHDRAAKWETKPMGTLVTTAYAEAVRALEPFATERPIVIGVSHVGGVRAGLLAGDITVLDVGEVLPFANNLRAYRYTGRQLKALMEFGYNGCKLGRIQTSGVEVELDKKGHVKRIFYAAPGQDRIELKDATPLVIVADDFMTTGGDGYSTDFFPEADRIPGTYPTITDAFINYLKAIPEI